MGGLALVLLLLVGCIGQEVAREPIGLAPETSVPSFLPPALAPAPLEVDPEGIIEQLECEDKEGRPVTLTKRGPLHVLAEELICEAEIQLLQDVKQTIKFDLTGDIDFDVQFYTREDEGHSQMILQPYFSKTTFIYDTSKLVVQTANGRIARDRREGLIQHALATRTFLREVGEDQGELELELFTHEPVATATLYIQTLSAAPKLTKKQAQDAHSLMLNCCVERSLCAEAAGDLLEELEGAGDFGPEDQIPVELCRSPVAICRDGAVKAWLLDLQVFSCNLGENLQPFKDSLESVSCFGCRFGEDNDLEALAKSLKGFNSLHDVHLPSASLSGSVTCDWAYLQNLRVLDLDDNPSIIGTLPTCFNKAEFGLVSLSLQRCSLQGGLQAIPNIRHLHIASNFFKGKLDSAVPKNANADQMLTLDAKNNSFSGNLPRLPRFIRSFDVGMNNFEGEVPEEYSRLRFLVDLRLDSNRLNGALPELPPSMEVLNVSSNAFSGALPDFSDLTNLWYFNVENNELTGPLPKTLPETLKYINVANNGFEGPVPDSYSDLPSVEVIQFSSNNLTGPLPEGLFVNKPNLQTVLFNNNSRLSGPLPTDWQAPQLQNVQMAGCALTGSIPFELGALPRLSNLVLSGNALEGTLDEFAEGLVQAGERSDFGVQLITCLLNDNEITGSIPDGFNQSITGVAFIPSSGRPVPKRFSFNSNPMDGPIPQFVLNAVLDLNVGRGFVEVRTQGTEMECPSADDLPTLPSNEEAQQIVKDRGSQLFCLRDGEKISVDDIYIEAYGGTPSDDDLTNTLAPGPILQAPEAPTISIALPPPPPTDQLGFPPSLSAESTSDPDLDSRSIDIDSQAGETGEVVEGEGDSGEAGDKKSGGGTDGGVVAAAVLVPLTIIVLAVGGYICFRRSGSRFQRFEAGS